VSEPKAVATRVDEIAPGVWHWHLHDERTDLIGSAHAVRGEDGVVLVDPHPLVPEAFESLGKIEAIALTTSSHQRSSWRLRRELGVPVHAPAAVREVEEEPDVRYAEGDRLPGGLLAIFTPGAGTTQHSFLLEREGGILFTPDLFVRPPKAALMLFPVEYMHDPEQVRRTIEQLLERDFSVLCTGHGEPVLEDAKDAVRAALSA
jgi:glyoxylase-like metal-dependent hydrolase (beta-lactamase superfamily II)